MTDAITSAIQQEIQKAQKPLLEQIAELERKVDAAEDWANGVFLLLEQILPFLLRGHPDNEKIRDLLQKSDVRYEELLAKPNRADSDESAGLYEASKMLYRQMALQGVWTGIDPKTIVQKTLAQFARQPSE